MSRRWIGAVALAVLTACAAAAPAGAATRQERAAKQALNRVERAAKGELGKRGLTLALRDLALKRRALRGADARRARELAERPTDPGGDGLVEYTVPETTPVCGGGFCIHYVTSTIDAPDLTDASGASGTGAPNGVPDYVDEMLREFEHVGEFEQAPPPGGQGWGAPVPDGTVGGGADQFDVYIAEIGQDCCFGYANPEPTDSGFQWPAYMVMDDDYALDEFGYADPTAPLQVTAAHEYNHVLQFALDVRFDAWIGEAVATWMEDKVYSDVNDWARYLERWAQYPELPLTAFPDDDSSIKVYGSSLFIHWLSERYGDRSVREAFQALPEVDPAMYSPAAFDRAIALRGGTTLSSAFARFAAATAEIRAPGAGLHEGPTLPGTVRREGALLDGGTVSATIDHTAMRFWDVPQNGSKAVKLTVAAPADTTSALALVARRGPATTGELTTRFAELPAGGVGSVVLNDFDTFDRVTAVLVNSDTKVGGGTFDEDTLLFDWNYLRDGRAYTARLTSDLDAPTTTIVSGPSGDVGGATQAFAFAADEVGATFACSVDGAPFAPCASPDVRNYAPGAHAFAVRATDAEGNVEAEPAKAAFRVVPAASPPPAADIAALTVAALRNGARTLASKFGKHGIRTLRRNGAAYAFAAPSAGRLTITLKAGKRTLASLSRSASKEGTLRGRLKGTKKARAGVLKKSKRLRATLTVRFTPTGGARRSVSRKVTLKR